MTENRVMDPQVLTVLYFQNISNEHLFQQFLRFSPSSGNSRCRILAARSPTWRILSRRVMKSFKIEAEKITNSQKWSPFVFFWEYCRCGPFIKTFYQQIIAQAEAIGCQKSFSYFDTRSDSIKYQNFKKSNFLKIQSFLEFPKLLFAMYWCLTKL